MKFRSSNEAFQYVLEQRLVPSGGEDFYGLVRNVRGTFDVEIATDCGRQRVKSASMSERRPVVDDLVRVSALDLQPGVAYSHPDHHYVIRAVLNSYVVDGEFPEKSPVVEPEVVENPSRRVPIKPLLAILVTALIVAPVDGMEKWFASSIPEPSQVVMAPFPSVPFSYAEFDATPMQPLPSEPIEPIDAVQLTYVAPPQTQPQAESQSEPVAKPVVDRCERAEGVEYLVCTDPEVRYLHNQAKSIDGYDNARRFWCDSITSLYDLKNCVIDVANYVLTRQ